MVFSLLCAFATLCLCAYLSIYDEFAKGAYLIPAH